MLPTIPKELTEQNVNAYIPDDPDQDPSLSDSSLKKKRNDNKKSVENTRNMTHQTRN